VNRVLRDGSGLLLLLLGLASLGGTVIDVRGHDYVAAMLWATVGLALVRAAVALLRPSMGE
jgi:hypothetical protein